LAFDFDATDTVSSMNFLVRKKNTTSNNLENQSERFLIYSHNKSLVIANGDPRKEKLFEKLI